MTVYPEYTILSNSSYAALSGEVMIKLDEGWKLQGGVAIAVNSKNENSYAQAMVRGISNESEN